MKKYRPTTPGRRGMTVVSYKKTLTASKPHKPLTKGGKRDVGRNNRGTITMRHRGGGHKRRLRDIDFKYDKRNIPAKVETIEYDPNRSGFIALVLYADGERRYVLLPQSVAVGDTFIVAEDAPLKPGNRLPLAKVPIGTFVYNIELKPEGGAKIARSAGNYAEVIAHDGGYVNLKMPSSEVRKVPEKAWASIGEVSNEEHKLVVLGKAGRSRWLGKRPTVRGSAMNPVDHPHGGGEGRGGRGHRRARTKWGKPSGKGQKTRTPKKYSNYLIVRRRKVGKKR
ncbi:50S ribosomal protein L2 [Candidatus Kaiserbacteria bacterium CG10_big_fil_rev_8_21_14_0_10_49_17]|uniref:Large ribosomal subunit protein uL2 n=1 Tax=Candidatus Kaiserbacteria bacterium CG10_big_fil_rev_8_21_14_0_10_49_17 TaxID=1974609 RepID=A0A2M6WEJ1_9BACT|nr:MAG: 50S ribosomal protein L2 [Candidatus Kaiserbacteria bacterium CG10_big_fil_rev_8_21_14_0_10_49_17]